MIEIIIGTIVVYIMYALVTFYKFDKDGHVVRNSTKKLSENDQKVADYNALPNEAKYFIKKYNIDTNKINYKGLLKMIALILGLDIAIVVTIISFIDNIILQLLGASILLIPLFLISLHILGKYLEKRGLTKDETDTKFKRNRK